jgi:hypothetical protein
MAKFLRFEDKLINISLIEHIQLVKGNVSVALGTTSISHPGNIDPNSARVFIFTTNPNSYPHYSKELTLHEANVLFYDIRDLLED